MHIFKKPYDKHVRIRSDVGGDSCTIQSAKKECDINHIIAKHNKTGLITHVNKYQGRYEDLSQPVDYQTALNIVQNASDSFASLSSDIRKQFDNDPAKFLEFATNPENQDEMREMGLLPKNAREESPVTVTDPEPAPTSPVEPQPPE